MLENEPGPGQANYQGKVSSSNTDHCNDITTDSLTYYYSQAAFLSGYMTAVPFIVSRTLQSKIAL